MQVFDYRGKECPEGYVLAMRVIDRLSVGEEAEVLMDSWRCAAMIIYSLKENRKVRVDVDKDGNVIRFRFTRVS
nr:sulfurtransferase TusA family protein [Acidilobus saccharovorans]